MSAIGCILYLIPAERLWIDAKLEKAQQHALEQRLPLAVITCILPKQYGGKLPMLQALETQLSRYQLPLIVLIGTEAATLPSLVKHAKPVHVYGHGGDAAGKRVTLQPHPYAWPGVVIKTGELKKIVDKNDYMC